LSTRELVEKLGDVEAAMRGRERREATTRLLELPAACDAPAGDAGVVPGDDRVDEALEEVALGRVGAAPGLLERLVRCEEIAGVRELEPPLVRGSDLVLSHVGGR